MFCKNFIKAQFTRVMQLYYVDIFQVGYKIAAQQCGRKIVVASHENWFKIYGYTFLK